MHGYSICAKCDISVLFHAHQPNTGSNIFLSSNGSIKLGDFGIARELRGNLSKKTLKERDADICKVLFWECVF